MRNNFIISCLLILFSSCGLFHHHKKVKVEVISTQEEFKRNIPKPTGYVNDYEKLFSAEQNKSLDSFITAIEKETTIEFAVVTLDTLKTTAAEFDSLTLIIANSWGVGKKEKDNGILIGLSAGYRKIRIQNGYGISKVVSDEQTKNIIETVIKPYFKKGKYYDGTFQGILAMMKLLNEK